MGGIQWIFLADFPVFDWLTDKSEAQRDAVNVSK